MQNAGHENRSPKQVKQKHKREILERDDLHHRVVVYVLRRDGLVV